MKQVFAKEVCLASIALLLFSQCKKVEQPDATGTFEAEEVIISSETSGTLKEFDVDEGQMLRAGQYVGYVDSLQLFLKKKQLQASVSAVLSKRPNVSTQLSALEEQLKTAEHEKQRMTNLRKADVATGKQFDDAVAQVNILKKQIEAQQSALNTTSQGLSSEAQPLAAQIAQVNDQLKKCRIMNPLTGTVLTKYSEAFELVSPGKALYKLADLTYLTLRAYISGDQLSKIKLNQEVKVFTDNGAEKMNEYKGEVVWISDKAEFTPKTIQTKDERANLVYAIKIRVKNDGLLKIGMYGEVKL